MNNAFSYETIGSSSYLVASFADSNQIIHYQMQMMINNDIKNILKVNKRQMNDDIMLSYNITSKISLDKMIERNGMKKDVLIRIIEQAIQTMEDLEEYQLVGAGILFDEKYIFLNPSTLEPHFVYLPCYADGEGVEQLKSFVMSLILGSKIETTNDNFIQVLLSTLNDRFISKDSLRKFCNEFKAGKNVIKTPSESIKRQQVEPEVEKPVEEKTPDTSIPSVKPNDSIGKTTPNIKQKPNTDVLENPKTADTGKEKKKNTFLIIQLVFLALIVGISFSGVINDANGNMNMSYLAALVIVIAGLDFFVYKKMFAGKNENKTAKTTVEKKEDKKNSNVPKKDGGVPTPVKKTPPIHKTEGTIQKETQENEKIEKTPASVPPVNTPPVEVPPVFTPVQAMGSYGENDATDVLGNEMDATDIMIGGGSCPYLEFYENGLATKIKLDKPVVVVGRLSSQCDFAINSSKVGRVHAEFITRGNECFVKDCNSTNGTYLNGSVQRIASNVEHLLTNGCRVTLADVDLTFRC